MYHAFYGVSVIKAQTRPIVQARLEQQQISACNNSKNDRKDIPAKVRSTSPKSCNMCVMGNDTVSV